jgi:hypothetical protein
MVVMIEYGHRREFQISQEEANDVDLPETGSQYENSRATYS